MAAIAAANVTVTVNSEIRGGPKQKRNRVTIAFGNGSLTYPSGGVPMPAIGSFGMVTALDGLVMIDAHAANGFLYKFDRANRKIRIYQGDNDNASDAALIELVTATAPAAASLIAEAIGW